MGPVKIKSDPLCAEKKTIWSWGPPRCCTLEHKQIWCPFSIFLSRTLNVIPKNGAKFKSVPVCIVVKAQFISALEPTYLPLIMHVLKLFFISLIEFVINCKLCFYCFGNAGVIYKNSYVK